MDHSFSEILLMSLLDFSPRKSLCFAIFFINAIQLSMPILSVVVVIVFTTGTLSSSSFIRDEKLYFAVILPFLLSAVFHSSVWADRFAPKETIHARSVLCKIVMFIEIFDFF